MKITFKGIFQIFVATLILSATHAEAESSFDKLDCAVTTDFAWYPKTTPVAGGTHFAPVTGIYSSLEARSTLSATYRIHTPLGDHFLLNDANVAISGLFEFTPVSIKPGARISFTPVPFLVFSSGAEAGTGWDFASLFTGGIAEFSSEEIEPEYNALSPFCNWFLKVYFQGTFQFDTGAIFKGDWNHVLMQFSYQAYYQRMTGISDGEIWMWQCTGGKVNGWQEYMSALLAYQMPIVLHRAGILFESEGYYSDEAFNQEKYKNYDSDFKTISLSPLCQFTFGKKDTLTVAASFSSRRSFEEEHTKSTEEPILTHDGREWYFRRIALSWAHKL